MVKNMTLKKEPKVQTRNTIRISSAVVPCPSTSPCIGMTDLNSISNTESKILIISRRADLVNTTASHKVGKGF